MSLLDEVDLGRTQAMEPPPPRRSRVGPILSLAIVAGLLAGFWVYRARQSAPSAPPASGAVAPPALKPTPLASDTPAVALPPLADLDPFIRDTVSGLTKATTALAWLATNHLAEQFVAIVQGTAEGQAPMQMLAPLKPGAPFRVATRGGRTVIDPASYGRYNGFADAVGSLEPTAAAGVYGTLKPRLEEAYAQLGIANSSVDAAVEGALVKLLSTRVPDDPIEVQASGGVYVFADPALEQLSSAQKLLIRTGPANARRIQARLREIAMALGIPAARLPGT